MAILNGSGRPVDVVAADPQVVLERLRCVLDHQSPAAFEPAPPDGLAAEQQAVRQARVPESVDLVVRTSGSTGHPKRVLLSARALRASAQATAERIGTGQWLLALPVNYIAGIQVLVRSLLARTAPVECRPIHFCAESFLHAAERMSGRDRYTALVPAQLAALLDHPQAVRALSSFRAVLIGGQRLAPGLRRRAAAAGVPIVTTYGCTETAGGCAYDGVALRSVELNVVGESIRVAGPTLAEGYLDHDQGVRAPTRFLVEDGRRWLNTGDRGRLEAGVLTVIGREDQLIVTGGLKLDLDEVEAALHELPGLESAVVVPFADEAWGTRFSGFADGGPGRPRLALDTINAHLHQRLGRQATAVAFSYVEGGLPRLASGKVDRQALARTVVLAPAADPGRLAAAAEGGRR